MKSREDDYAWANKSKDRLAERNGGASWLRSIHVYADIIPSMSESEYEQLRDDIAQHGLREPIWTLDGKILDGRHRWRACQELGLRPKTRPYTGADPLAFVVSLNLHRRHRSKRRRRQADWRNC